MVALATLMSWDGSDRLGGAVCLSGIQVLAIDESQDWSKVAATPLFLYHGSNDDLLPVQ